MLDYLFEKVNPFYHVGGIVGCVVGYAIAKIYQIWAIAYRKSGFDPNMTNSWSTDSPPQWVWATEHPNAFTFWMVIVYIGIGLLLVKLCLAGAAISRAKNATNSLTQEV
ncbi:hypothetical protein [Paenibacillus sp. YAF4_2]|uniref:hypothetical protein n=1 Tax=Paenibacillus sp. YAF4_2 TaxID=3233085 RepID=UPI003F960A68